MNASAPLDDKLVAILEAFRRADIPYAVGGAVALGYYGEPRGTIDIDINVFLEPQEADVVFDVLQELIGDIDRASALATVRRDGQIRIRWGHTPIDLFFLDHPFHEACARRTRDVPFGPDTITILSAEDLLIFKAFFNRPKDWLDIEQVLFATAGELDTGCVRDWLVTLAGEGDPPVKSFDAATRTILGH